MLARLALANDWPALAALAQACVAERAPHLTFDAQRAHDTLLRALVIANPTVFVVEHRREVVGFLVASITPYVACAGFYVVQDVFYVRPDMRGTRAAAELFATFHSWAKTQQPQEIIAGVGWGDKMAAGARWLRRFGYQPGPQIMRHTG